MKNLISLVVLACIGTVFLYFSVSKVENELKQDQKNTEPSKTEAELLKKKLERLKKIVTFQRLSTKTIPTRSLFLPNNNPIGNLPHGRIAVPAAPITWVHSYPESYTNDIGKDVRLYYASQHPDQAAYVDRLSIYQASDDQEVISIPLSKGDSGREIPFQECSAFNQNGCAYEQNITLPTGKLKAGIYYVFFSDKKGFRSQQTFLVIRSKMKNVDRAEYDVALIHPSFTWAGYNPTGGRSFYKNQPKNRKFEVSLNRPINASIKNSHHSSRSIVPFARTLKRLGVRYLNLSSLDVHQNPEILKKVKVVILAGHDEYWTRNIHGAVQSFMASGGWVASFSGNTAWAYVNYKNRSLFIDYASRTPLDSKSPYTGTGINFAETVNLPTGSFLGSTYQEGGYSLKSSFNLIAAIKRNIPVTTYQRSGGIEIVDKAHPVFRGINRGDGKKLWHDIEVVFDELDGVPLKSDGSIDRMWATRIPRNTRVLARGIIHNANFPAFHTHPGGRQHIAGIVLETKKTNGGGIINFGSMGWYRLFGLESSLGDRFLANTLQYMGIRKINAPARRNAKTLPPALPRARAIIEDALKKMNENGQEIAASQIRNVLKSGSISPTSLLAELWGQEIVPNSITRALTRYMLRNAADNGDEYAFRKMAMLNWSREFPTILKNLTRKTRNSDRQGGLDFSTCPEVASLLDQLIEDDAPATASEKDISVLDRLIATLDQCANSGRTDPSKIAISLHSYLVKDVRELAPLLPNLEQLARNGLTSANLALGIIYHFGVVASVHGVEVKADMVKALKFFKFSKSEDAKEAGAGIGVFGSFALAEYSYLGHGKVKKDIAVAIEATKKAAIKGYKPAMINMAYFILHHKDLAASQVSAEYWLRSAAGHPISKKAIRFLEEESKLTKSD